MTKDCYELFCCKGIFSSQSGVRCNGTGCKREPVCRSTHRLKIMPCEGKTSLMVSNVGDKVSFSPTFQLCDRNV